MSGLPPGDVTIRCRHLLTMHGAPLADGWLRVRRGRILGLGVGPLPAAARGPAVVDVGDAIVMPGLVNAHTHLEFSDVTAPLEAAGGLPGWIRRVVALRRERSAAGDDGPRVAAAIRAGLAESGRAGVTTVGEIATTVPPDGFPHDGPRVRVFREALGLSPTAGRVAMRATAADVRRLSTRGVAAGLSPHAPYSVAAPLGRELLALAVRRGFPVAMHLAESAAEEELLASGTGPFRRLLEDLGAWQPSAPPRLLPTAEWISRLARTRRGILVHGTHLDRDATAVARLARHRDRLAVVVCPRTTRALAGVLPPLATFRAAGVRVAIGTDSRVSNPDLSVLAECRTLVSAGVVSPLEALRMATVEGAWALAFEDRAGRLAPGHPADLVVLRPSSIGDEPHAAALDPATRIVATLRAGRVIAGSLASGG